MRVAVMQPYIFAYIGYYQLVAAVDVFVFLDDVNLIKRGFVNRNTILIDNRPWLFSIPLVEASQNRHINQTFVIDDDRWRSKLLRTYEVNYAKAINFEQIKVLMANVIEKKHITIGEMAKKSIVSVFEYLGLKKRFIDSSSDFDNSDLKGQKRILDICQQLGASEYVNLPGGKKLYNKQDFEKRGIKLKFLEPGNVCYKQGGNKFTGNMSILDVLAWNTRKESAAMLNQYKLV